MNEKEITMLLLLLEWQPSEERIFRKYKAWQNEQQVLWLVPGSKQAPEYFVFCNNKSKIYTEDWIHIDNTDVFAQQLGI